MLPHTGPESLEGCSESAPTSQGTGFLPIKVSAIEWEDKLGNV